MKHYDSYSMLKVPFQQTWKRNSYLTKEGQSPAVDTTLYITKCLIYTSQFFAFERAGILILGEDPYSVPYYLWITNDNSTHILNLQETPICILPLTLWKLYIESDPETIQKVEVHGFATIIRKD